MTVLSKLMIGLTMLLIFTTACEKEDTFTYPDHLVNSSWWASTECSDYHQLHFNSDKTGFLTSEITCDDCPYILRFNWTVNSSGVVTVTYSEFAMTCASDALSLPGTETTTATKTSIYLYGMQWSTD